MIGLRITSAAAVMAAALILAPQGASAQYNNDFGATVHKPKKVDVSVQAGAAIPADHLQDFTNVGLNVGADAAWHLTNSFALRVDGDYDGLPGEKNVPLAPGHNLPDVRLFHAGAGVEYDLGSVQGNDTDSWFVTTNVGAGVTTLNTDTFLHVDGTQDHLTHTYPDVDAGLEVGYHLSRNVTAALGGQGMLAFSRKADLAPLAEMNPNGTPFSQTLVFPITASISVDLR